MIHVSNALLRDKTDPEWKPYLILCIKNCQDLSICFPVVGEVVEGILSMALRDSTLSTLEARQLKEEQEQKVKHHDVLGQVVATFALDLNLAMSSPDKAGVHALAQQFKDLALLNEFTDYTKYTAGQNSNE